MATWKTPPIAKIYEALTAIADNRVQIDHDARCADVASSDGQKHYLVTWNPERTAFGSNDNASYWQGYMGYPIVAALLLLGKLGYSPDVAQHLADVPWKKINDSHKRNYEAAIDQVLTEAAAKGASREAIETEVRRIAAELSSLSLDRVQSRRPPTG